MHISKLRDGQVAKITDWPESDQDVIGRYVQRTQNFIFLIGPKYNANVTGVRFSPESLKENYEVEVIEENGNEGIDLSPVFQYPAFCRDFNHPEHKY